MSTYVYELRGSMSNIEQDTDLIFPNIQTCLGVVAVVRGQLVGVHLTMADQGRLDQAMTAFHAKCGGKPGQAYLVGNMSAGWSGKARGLRKFAQKVVHVDTTRLGHVDLRAVLGGNDVTFGVQPTGSKAAGFQAISGLAFTQV